MRHKIATRIRLTLTFFLNYLLIVLGSLLFASPYTPPTSSEFRFHFFTFLIALFMTGIYWGVWEVDLRLRQRNRNENTTSQKDNESLVKRKRDRIDSVLRELSDDELLRLHRRLAAVDDDELYAQLVDAEGELLVDDHRRE